jgi:hypothetical protein
MSFQESESNFDNDRQVRIQLETKLNSSDLQRKQKINQDEEDMSVGTELSSSEADNNEEKEEKRAVLGHPSNVEQDSEESLIFSGTEGEEDDGIDIDDDDDNDF